jgi:hypothetical protein
LLPTRSLRFAALFSVCCARLLEQLAAWYGMKDEMI